MIKSPFYSITELEHTDNTITAMLVIDKNSEIFRGHFPGQPVLPGACMLQMVKEVIERVIGKRVRFIKANDIKFLTIIDPNLSGVLHLLIKYNLSNDGISVWANLSSAGIACFKIKGLVQAIEL